MSKKYQIFISSTYLDLVKEREQVIKACLEMGHIPVGMEMFSAADEEQWKVIQRQIDEIDYYVILIAHRYGSTTNEGVSFTEKEYDYAVSKGIPILGFVIENGALWPADRVDVEEGKKLSLISFKEKVKAKLVNFWSNKDELHAKFSIALMKAIVNNPRSGWVKAEDSIGSDVMKELARLSGENSTLRKENESLKKSESNADDESKLTINILARNKKELNIWYEGDKDWTEVDQISLLQIFQAIAPNLIGENPTLNIAKDVALHFAGAKKYRNHWPVPSNEIASWITDLHALELIETSKKKHAVADKNEYWSLTKKGKSVISSIRKLHLIGGISERKDAPNGNDPAKKKA